MLGLDEDCLLVGLFGTSHPSRMLSLSGAAIREMAVQFPRISIMYIGPHGDAYRSALGEVPFADEGFLPEEAISQRFHAMDIFLTPFVDGVSTRRGSMMTALQHGVATVGTLGSNTDSVLRAHNGEALLLAGVNQTRDFIDACLSIAADARLRDELGRKGRELYERNFGWSIVSMTMLERMACLKDKQTGRSVVSSHERYR
jgi:glycosyltransferase involved in cell wall biosynthesis